MFLKNKEIPILFSTPMVEAVDKDRKSITRRTRNLKKINISPDKWELSMTMDNWTNSKGEHEDKFSVLFTHKISGKQVAIPCPYGMKGDVLWVREAWNSYNENSYGLADKTIYLYKALGSDSNSTWKPSIHMPKAASRTFLQVTNIRIERLHQIDETEAVKEGIHFDKDSGYWFAGDEVMAQSALHAFQDLWIKINKKRSWDKNPWVWVIEFKKIKNYLEQKAGIQQATDDYKKQLQATCPHPGWVTGTAEGSYCVRCSKPLIG